MLCRILPSVLTALAVVVLPQIVAAEEADQGPPPLGPAAAFGRPGWAGWSEAARPAPGPRFDPKVLFKRLDANADGKVTADEIPAAAPDRLKALLKRADVNGDRQVSPDELAEAVKKMRERVAGNPQGATVGRVPGAPVAGPGGPFPPGPGDFAPGPWGSRRGWSDAMTGPTPPAGPRGFARGPRGGWRGWQDAMTGPTPPPGPRDFARGPWGGWRGWQDAMTGPTPPAGWRGWPDATTGPTPPAGPRSIARGPWAGWHGWADAMTGPTPPPGPRGFAHNTGWEGWPGAADARVGRGRGPGRGARWAEDGFGGPPQAGPDRRPGPPYAAQRAGLPGPRALFRRLDKDGDEELSIEEFTAGMMYLYGATLPPDRPTADGPPGPRVRKPRPPRAGADYWSWGGWGD